MKVSIITVCYNSGATIEDTISSVLSQTHPDIEYIIIDGLSTDGTIEIVNRYRDQIKVFVSEKDTGIYDAMNKGVQAATGDIIGILNSDDIYKNNDVIERIAAAFEPNVDCVSTDVEIFSSNPENVVRYYSATRWKPWMFRIGHQPPHPGFFVRRQCYQSAGLFNTQYKLAADFDMLYRLIVKNHFSVKYLPWISVSMRSGGASQNSFSNIRRANREVHHSLKSNGAFSLPFLIWLKYPLKVFQFLLR